MSSVFGIPKHNQSEKQRRQCNEKVHYCFRCKCYHFAVLLYIDTFFYCVLDIFNFDVSLVTYIVLC